MPTFHFDCSGCKASKDVDQEEFNILLPAQKVRLVLEAIEGGAHIFELKFEDRCIVCDPDLTSYTAQLRILSRTLSAL